MSKFLMAFMPISIFTILFILNFLAKKPRPFFKSLCLSLSGIVSLVALMFMENFTGITIPINFLSLGIAALLGVPGVGFLTVLNTIFV